MPSEIYTALQNAAVEDNEQSLTQQVMDTLEDMRSSGHTYAELTQSDVAYLLSQRHMPFLNAFIPDAMEQQRFLAMLHAATLKARATLIAESQEKMSTKLASVIISFNQI